MRTAVRWFVAPLVTVLVASFGIFVALSLAPGDPVAALVGKNATAEQIEAIRHELGLDQPLIVRYWHWLSGVAHGDFGDSSVYHGQSVSSLLVPRVPTTTFLVVYAALLIVVLGVALGILGATSRPGGPVTSVVSSIGIAVPAFVAAVLLVLVFSLRLGWFPAVGEGSGFADQLHHLTLPAIALSIGSIAYIAQITRSALVEEQSREHVETARGRGLSRQQVFRRHVLHNAALPIITIAGLIVAGLIAGAVIVESAFGINGVGSLLVSSVQGKDYNVVLAISLVIVLIFVLVTTALDALQFVLDPRVRDKVTTTS